MLKNSLIFLLCLLLASCATPTQEEGLKITARGQMDMAVGVGQSPGGR